MMAEEEKTEDTDNDVEVDLGEIKSSEEEKKEEPKEEKQEVVEEKQVEKEAEKEVEEKAKPTKFQKRIDDLTHRQREAERQRDEYYKVATQTMEENKLLRDQAKRFGEIGKKEMEGNIESSMDSAKLAYKKAYEEGNADDIVEAQQKMVEAASRRGELKELSQVSDQSKLQQGYDRSIPPPPNSKAVSWASKNSWFNKDMVMTNAAYTIHDELIKSGLSGDSDNYYDQLDERLKQEFPHKLSSEEQTDQKNEGKFVTQTPVTPAGNQSPKKSRKVKLTPSQVAVAKRLGVPLEEYAKQFVALNS